MQKQQFEKTDIGTKVYRVETDENGEPYVREEEILGYNTINREMFATEREGEYSYKDWELTPMSALLHAKQKTLETIDNENAKLIKIYKMIREEDKRCRQKNWNSLKGRKST